MGEPILMEGDAIVVPGKTGKMHYVCIYAGVREGQNFYNLFDSNGKIITVGDLTCKAYLNSGAVIIKSTDGVP